MRAKELSSLASTLKAQVTITRNHPDRDPLSMVLFMVQTIGWILAAHNNNFDCEKFCQDCGLTEEEIV